MRIVLVGDHVDGRDATTSGQRDQHRWLVDMRHPHPDCDEVGEVIERVRHARAFIRAGYACSDSARSGWMPSTSRKPVGVEITSQPQIQPPPGMSPPTTKPATPRSQIKRSIHVH